MTEKKEIMMACQKKRREGQIKVLTEKKITLRWEKNL